VNRKTQILIVLAALPTCALAGQDWYALTYLGRYSARKYDEVPFRRDWDLKDQYMGTVGLGREMARITSLWGLDADLGMELEGLISQHWGRYNRDYQEFVGSFNLRWHKFPWNECLPTTLGHGVGLSYATLVPEHEVLYRRGKSARLLAFLMWDVTFSLPGCPNWAVFFRIHHRSGGYGTFSGVHGAANYPAIGVKYLF
jgi:hypothetical protein